MYHNIPEKSPYNDFDTAKGRGNWEKRWKRHFCPLETTEEFRLEVGKKRAHVLLSKQRGQMSYNCQFVRGWNFSVEQKNSPPPPKKTLLLFFNLIIQLLERRTKLQFRWEGVQCKTVAHLCPCLVQKMMATADTHLAILKSFITWSASP